MPFSSRECLIWESMRPRVRRSTAFYIAFMLAGEPVPIGFRWMEEVRDEKGF